MQRIAGTIPTVTPPSGLPINRRNLALVLAGLVLAVPAFAADPVATFPVFLKILSFDANLGLRGTGSGTFTILLVGDSADRSVREASVKSLAESRISSIHGRDLRFLAVEFTDKAALKAQVASANAAALMTTSHATGKLIATAVELAKELRLYTLAMDETAVAQGMLLGVQDVDGYRKILLNRQTANSIRAQFDENVFKYVKLVE